MPGDLFARRIAGGYLMSDPIVDEVRRHRMEHTREFGGDLKLICEDFAVCNTPPVCRSFAARPS